ncbi:MAG TPA: hypothetical protein VH857_00120 [Actinomycetes bacterium]|nr:hypothetical protein [Actinomycetes bacterium]
MQFSLVTRVSGVHRVLGCLDVVVEVSRGVGCQRVGDRLVADRDGLALVGGHDRTVRQPGRRGNGPGIPLTTPL